MGDAKRVFVFPEDDAGSLVVVRPRGWDEAYVRREMRGAGALLRYYGIRVTIRTLADYLGVREDTIRKRLERHPDLGRLIGLMRDRPRPPKARKLARDR